jgi:hypothetical protein
MGSASSILESKSHDPAKLLRKLGNEFENFAKVAEEKHLTWNNIESNFSNEKAAAEYMKNYGVSNHDHQVVLWKKYQEFSKSKPSDELPPIRLIPFDTFASLTEFPRFPDNSNLTVIYPNDIDYENSFIVFVSHCWLSGWTGAPDYRGRPHPDNLKNSKFQLCKKGIEQTIQDYCPQFRRCYIWLDYGCINQDQDPAGELKQLDEIVKISDCIFTPLYDDKIEQAIANGTIAELNHLPDKIQNWYRDFLVDAWNKTDFSYLNRCWCRVEMFYAANIPFNLPVSEERLAKFKGNLAVLSKYQRRAHLLYSSYEFQENLPPIILPPLSNTYLKEFNPAAGKLSVASDRQKIVELMNNLKPLIKPVKFHYEGADLKPDPTGKMNGCGTVHYENGDIFEGEFKNNVRYKGKYVYSNGTIYQGEYAEDGSKKGHGEQWFPSGNYYKGQWSNDMMNGPGEFKTKEQTLVGNFLNNKLHGKQNDIHFSDGSSYEGDMKNGLFCGKGMFLYANGDYYEGDFENHLYHGEGKLMKKSENNSYIGHFFNGQRSGYGIYTYSNGDIYKGEFLNGKRHGKGEFYFRTTQDIFKGNYVNDKKHGEGIYIFENDENAIEKVVYDMDKLISRNEQEEEPGEEMGEYLEE